MDNVKDIYDKMEANCCNASIPCSQSKEIWKLRDVINISHGQRTPKIMLDKAVAMLAKGRHMSGWFNQCPVAAGIIDPYKDNRDRVDLVHWDEETNTCVLVELEWKNNDPLDALRKILRYGAA